MLIEPGFGRVLLCFGGIKNEAVVLESSHFLPKNPPFVILSIAKNLQRGTGTMDKYAGDLSIE